MSVIPLADLRAHSNKVLTADDAELQDMLDAAEAWVGRYIGAPLGVGARTFQVRTPSRLAVLPVAGVLSVSSLTDPDGVVVTPDDVDLAAGIVYLPYKRTGGPWSVSVMVDAAIPADVRLATLIIADHLWETQTGPATPTAMQDSIGLEIEMARGTGYAIPNRARALLDPIVMPGAA